MKIKIIIIGAAILLSGKSNGQISSVNLGGSLHTGAIQGNSAPVSTLGGSFFIDFFPWFEHDVSFRLGYTYSQKVEYFLPEDRAGRYYPLLKIFSLRGFIRQDISFPVYLEVGAGLIYLNDRTLADVNEWEAGASFGAMAGIDFRKSGSKGITAGIGLDYGVAFMKTSANYYFIFLQCQYFF